MYRVFIIILVICTNVFAQLSLRKGMSNIQLNVISLSTMIKIINSFYIWIGLFLFGLSFVLYLYIVSKYQVSYIYPIITSGVFVLLMILSFALLGETFSVYKLGGLSLILIGIWMLS